MIYTRANQYRVVLELNTASTPGWRRWRFSDEPRRRHRTAQRDCPH
ncbi:hypothetical protein KCP71_16140 [Salmonella enterica subsp. enterica]|nr:hypothetical protein KCP71_16140 [Salmonella enterica subsp. enterica]